MLESQSGIFLIGKPMMGTYKLVDMVNSKVLAKKPEAVAIKANRFIERVFIAAKIINHVANMLNEMIILV